jgi:hypothetical protein
MDKSRSGRARAGDPREVCQMPMITEVDAKRAEDVESKTRQNQARPAEESGTRGRETPDAADENNQAAYAI